MQANEDTPSLRPERSESPQFPYREDFRHDQNEKRRPYICVRPELSAGDRFIQCDMLMNPPHQDYLCLSYMWGPQADQKTILIDGRLFRVGENLWRFLNRARLTVAQPVWIDAICIDQTDVEMQNHWVQQMGHIFQEAAEVLVWLGDDKSGIETALTLMNNLSPKGFRDSSSWFPETKKAWETRKPLLRDRVIFEAHYDLESFHEAMKQLVNLNYWDRLWIKQEVLVNQNVLYMYGSATVHHLSDFFCSCDQPGWWCTFHRAFRAGRTACSRILELKARNATSIQNGRPLEDLIRRFASSKCTNVLDKVYGLLGMTKGYTLTVDYTISPTELFVRTLVATWPFIDDTKDILDYFSGLINGLNLSEDDLRRDNLDSLLRKYESQYGPFPYLGNPFRWTTRLEFAPFALVARSDCRYWQETPVPGIANKSLEIRPSHNGAWSSAIKLFYLLESDVRQRYMSVTGDVPLKVGDVLLKLASGDVPSSLFLIARACDMQRDKFQVVAAAAFGRPPPSYESFQELDFNHPKDWLMFFDAPTAFKSVMISPLRHKPVAIENNFQARLDLHEMASISMTLNTPSSMQDWSWKMMEMVTAQQHPVETGFIQGGAFQDLSGSIDFDVE